MTTRTTTRQTRLVRLARATSLIAAVSVVGLAQAQTEPARPITPPTNPAATRATNTPAVQPGVEVVGPAPVAELEQRSVDFGLIYDTQPQETIFTIRNTGKGPLIIKSLSATCGCTVPVLQGTDGATAAGGKPAIKRQYAPGETAEIKVDYNPHGKNGQQHQRVTVETNDPAHPRIVFDIQATVRRMVNIEPSLVQFGAINKGETKTVMVDVMGRYPSFEIMGATLTTSSSPPVELANGKGETPQLSVDIWPIEDGTDGDEQVRRSTILLTIKDKAQVGTLSANLALAIKGYDGSTQVQNLRVYGEVVGDIQLLPNRLNFGMVTNGKQVEKTLKIISRRGQPFKILKVEEVPPMGADRKPRQKQFGAVSWSALPAEEGKLDAHLLTIAAEPKTTARTVYTEFIVFTDRKDEPKVHLKVYARVAPPVAPRRAPQQPLTRPVQPAPAGPPRPASGGGV